MIFYQEHVVYIAFKHTQQ